MKMNRALSTIPKLTPAVILPKYVCKTAAKTLLLIPNRTMATRLPKLCRCTVLPELKTTAVRWTNYRPRYVLCINSLSYSTNTSNPNNQKVVFASPKVVLGKEVTLKGLPSEKKFQESDDSTWRTFWDAADPYMKLARMDRPIGSWLLFWPCSWSITLAAIHAGLPLEQTLYNLALFLAGSFVMRGAGCTINDMWDRDIDKMVERTKQRPLVSGALTQKQALGFLAAQLSAGLAILLQLNWFSVALGASSMALVVAYPLAKRFTDYPQLFLGATFNWGALLGWSAQLGSVEPSVCLPLYAGALCWSVVYDTIYAHQDKADDARIGMKSTALTFGERTRPLLAVFAAGTLGGVCVAAHYVQLDCWWYIAPAAVAAHVGRQIYTLQPDNPQDCADKFKSNSLVGLMILLGIVAGGWRQYIDKRRGVTVERGVGAKKL